MTKMTKDEIARLTVGDLVEVRVHGNWYPGEVVEVKKYNDSGTVQFAVKTAYTTAYYDLSEDLENFIRRPAGWKNPTPAIDTALEIAAGAIKECGALRKKLASYATASVVYDVGVGRLREERDAAIRDRDSSLRYHNQLERERDEAVKQRDSYNWSRLEMSAAHDKMRGELETTRPLVVRAQKERDQERARHVDTLSRLEAAWADRDKIRVGTCNEMTKQLDDTLGNPKSDDIFGGLGLVEPQTMDWAQLVELVRTNKVALAGARRARDTAERERNAARAAQSSLAKQCDDLRGELATARGERDRVKNELTMTKGTLVHTQVELDLLKKERDDSWAVKMLQAELASCRADLASCRAERDKAWAKIADLENPARVMSVDYSSGERDEYMKVTIRGVRPGSWYGRQGEEVEVTFVMDDHLMSVFSVKRVRELEKKVAEAKKVLDGSS